MSWGVPPVLLSRIAMPRSITPFRIARGHTVTFFEVASTSACPMARASVAWVSRSKPWSTNASTIRSGTSARARTRPRRLRSRRRRWRSAAGGGSVTSHSDGVRSKEDNKSTRAPIIEAAAPSSSRPIEWPRSSRRSRRETGHRLLNVRTLYEPVDVKVVLSRGASLVLVVSGRCCRGQVRR